MTLTSASFPVAVVGAGPVGLAAAAHLLERGETPVVFEAGERVAASIRAWGHVRLFSPWKYLVDPASARLLAPTGWGVPDPERAPTGAELVAGYLEPLAAVPALRDALRLGTRVEAISRRGVDRLKDAGRDAASFVLRTRAAGGAEQELLAKAVIDASGTYLTPSPLGASGLAALGESAAAERIAYGIPDVLGADRARYAGKRVLVVGSGHSAFNALLDLAALAEAAPGTSVTWVLRRASVGLLYGGGDRDALPARGALGSRVKALMERGGVRQVSLRIAGVERTDDGLVVVGEDGSRLEPVDEIVAATGFRPDPSVTHELRLDLDPATEAPRALAPLIDPNVHSCGTVPPHGANALRHPERDFYTVGMKSYGRAPTFLLLTGYEQVRSVVAAIVGDEDAARRVDLVLPETGVCSTDLADGGCCDAGAAIVPATFVPLAVVAGPLLPVLGQAPVAVPTHEAVAVSACCPASEQAECCAADEKAACCGASAGGGACGCR